MSLNIVGWIVLGLLCWAALGLMVGALLGKVIKGHAGNAQGEMPGETESVERNHEQSPGL